MVSAKEKRDKRKKTLQSKRAGEAEMLEAASKHGIVSGVEDDGPEQFVLEASVDDVGSKLDARVAEKEAFAMASVQPPTEQAPAAALAESSAADADASTAQKKAKRKLKWTYETLSERVGPLAKLIELHDVNAPYAIFLMKLKGHRSSVPVPRHWSQKRAFLANQTTRERGDYVVPDFIRDTGVAAVRVDDGQANIAFAKKLQAAYVFPNPHDGDKTKLSRYGDVFHEMKDVRALRNNFVPGQMSSRLKKALGMTDISPPPWIRSLQLMKRLPPSYPNIKIPGLNAPLPPGAHWGDGVGMWGHPARNERDELVWPDVVNVSHKVSEKSPTAELYWGYQRPDIKMTHEAVAGQAPPAVPQPFQQPMPYQRGPVPPPPQQFMQAAMGGHGQYPGHGVLPQAPYMMPQQQWAQEYQRRQVMGDGVMAPHVVYEQQSGQNQQQQQQQQQQKPHGN